MTAFSVDTFAALVVFVAFTLLAGIMSAVGNVLPVLLALAGAGISAGSFLGLAPWEQFGKQRMLSKALP